MGFAALHIEKAKGNDAGTSAHIERTVHPKNADESRTHLNRKLIEFPEGVDSRTQAIQHRIETADITRKIKPDQVRALRIMLTGTHEDMQRIQSEGRLDEWCNDNLDWLQQTFGKDNVVSADLHMDEKSPHIHATVVPIVVGERRKAKNEDSTTKKKYKKKNTNGARLCADDVMTRDKLKSYQDTYAEKMQKYGLQRGIEGSEARHISTPKYYRELYSRNEYLQESITDLEQQKEEVNESVHYMYDMRDEAKEKFLSMNEHVNNKETELKALNTKLEYAQKAYEPYQAQDDLNFLTELFPKLKEYLRISELCKEIGFGVEQIKQMFVKAIQVTGDLFSPEHDKYFKATNAKTQIEKELDNPNKFRLTLNGTNILDWFRQKQSELLSTARTIKRPEQNQKRGRGI